MSDIEDMMDSELKSIYTELKNIIIKNFEELKDIDALDTLNNEAIEWIYKNFKLHPTNEFKAEMTNLYAFSKYVLLEKQQEEAIKKVNDDLNKLIDSTKIEWNILNDFKNQITFTKIKTQTEINDNSKTQSLLVKYRFDPDTDEIIYSLTGTYWGFDIYKEQLKALLEGTTVKSGSNYTPSDLKVNMGNNLLNINVNGIEIMIKKQ